MQTPRDEESCMTTAPTAENGLGGPHPHHLAHVDPEPDMVQLLSLRKASASKKPGLPCLEISDDEIASHACRDLVLVRRIDTEAVALQRQGELGLWVPRFWTGRRADRRRPSVAPAATWPFPPIEHRRRLVPRRRRPDVARYCFAARITRRLEPARQQLQPVHDCHRCADPARRRLRNGCHAWTARSARGSRTATPPC